MSDTTVILIHGLWMTGAEMSLLKRRLSARGFDVHQFRYRMVTRSLDHNLEKLRAFIAARGSSGVHLLGHSLGGVLALHALRTFPELPVERVVCLGSPLVDTAAGRRFARVSIGRAFLGKTLPEAIFESPLKSWSGPQQVGVVAGSEGFGLGRYVGALPKPNDGVVSVAETCLPGISDHLVVPIGHTALVISRYVAVQCIYFLRHGRFMHGNVSAASAAV